MGDLQLGIDGNRANQTASLDEVHFNMRSTPQYTHRSTIMNLDVLNSSGNGIYLSQGAASGGGAIDLISINSNNNKGDGIYLGVDDTYCLRCESSQNGGNGFTLFTAGNLHLTETKSWENQGDGYFLNAASGGLYTAIESQSNGGVGFNAYATQDLTVLGHFENDTTGVQLRNVNYSRFVGEIDATTGYGLQFATGPGNTTQNTFDLITHANAADLNGTYDASNRLILNGDFTSGLSVRGAPGFTGTVSGACTFTITGGIITNVAGC